MVILKKKKFETSVSHSDPGDTGYNEFTINHNLGTKYIQAKAAIIDEYDRLWPDEYNLGGGWSRGHTFRQLSSNSCILRCYKYATGVTITVKVYLEEL